MKDRLYRRVQASQDAASLSARKLGVQAQEFGVKARSVELTKVTRLAVMFCAVAALSIVQAHAQTTGGTYTLGTDGGPVGSDYLAASNGFASNIGPILKFLLPLLLAMFAVWNGPRIVKMLLSKFSRA